VPPDWDPTGTARRLGGAAAPSRSWLYSHDYGVNHSPLGVPQLYKAVQTSCRTCHVAYPAKQPFHSAWTTDPTTGKKTGWTDTYSDYGPLGAWWMGANVDSNGNYYNMQYPYGTPPNRSCSACHAEFTLPVQPSQVATFNCDSCHQAPDQPPGVRTYSPFPSTTEFRGPNPEVVQITCGPDLSWQSNGVTAPPSGDTANFRQNYVMPNSLVTFNRSWAHTPDATGNPYAPEFPGAFGGVSNAWGPNRACAAPLPMSPGAPPAGS